MANNADTIDLMNENALLKDEVESLNRAMKRWEAEVARLKAERGEFSDVLYRATQAEARIEAALAKIQSAADFGDEVDPDDIVKALKEEK